MNDTGRTAGRSGVGAVMGAKNLKAVAVRGTKGLKIAKPAAFTQAVLKGRDKLVKGPTTGGLTMLDEYYQIRGWDNQGRPTSEKLRKLGLA
jgi:aldehyde:ferredoxin oxidoreductase